ncbi:MAG: hypothetical protein KatS3mg101_0814 [Patescibacteria group bacterium]|nr:MAG: hypothetical protein KatS3mg101_0814 [Patescibacteria group bacterium]
MRGTEFSYPLYMVSLFITFLMYLFFTYGFGMVVSRLGNVTTYKY